MSSCPTASPMRAHETYAAVSEVVRAERRHSGGRTSPRERRPEVTVCSPSHKPVEPLARVLTLHDEESRTAPASRPVAPSTRAVPTRRSLTGAQQMEELHRRLELFPDTPFELILENLRSE